MAFQARHHLADMISAKLVDEVTLDPLSKDSLVSLEASIRESEGERRTLWRASSSAHANFIKFRRVVLAEQVYERPT